MARDLFGKDEFIEVYVDTPLDVYEARDPKGLYKLARAGKLPNLTGIGSACELESRTPCVFVDSMALQPPGGTRTAPDPTLRVTLSLYALWRRGLA